MSGDTINLTVVESVEQINLSVQESEQITVNFLEVATVDPRVAQAALDAQAAELAAEAAQVAAEAALASLQSSSLTYALIFG